MLFECLKEDVSQRKIFILQMHSTKGVRENILRAYHFTKNKFQLKKLYHSCFNNNFQKVSDQFFLKMSLGRYFGQLF